MTDANDTPTAVVAAAAARVAEASFDEISYRELSTAVGISERTVYRHFPTRAHLLTRTALALEAQLFAPAAFTDWAGLHDAVAQRFGAFDQHPAEAALLARAASVSPVSGYDSSFFAAAVRALVEETAPGLNPRDRRRTASALCLFASAGFWARCRTAFGAEAEEIYGFYRSSVREVLRAVPEGTWPQIALVGSQG